VSARLHFERLAILLEPRSSRISPPDQHSGVHENAQNKARREPEADQITDGALGEIEEAGRLILVHGKYWQTPRAVATTRSVLVDRTHSPLTLIRDE
jgi:hypothetical protein